MVFAIFSCDPPDENESANDNLTGTWHDLNDYKGVRQNHATGEIDSVSFPNILYHFNANGKYTVENEVPWGLPADGTWELDENTNVITFHPDQPFDKLGIAPTYKFEIISLTEDLLKVNYSFLSPPLKEGQDTIKMNMIRTFEKL